jgi:pre-60S factor REI1
MQSFTCLSCRIALPSADHQRIHYKTDWHRYNLKRKVTELPPISAVEFNQRITTLQQSSKAAAAQASDEFACDVCRKSYASQNGFDQHCASKKHIEAQQKIKSSQSPEPTAISAVVNALKEETQRSREIHQKLIDARTEEQVKALLEEKTDLAMRLTPDHDCLFCPHQSADIPSNLEHMAKKHSFFIPDIEYVIDLPGLLQHVSDMISVHHVCLWCQLKGKTFHSMEGVRKHMLDKGHTKLDFEDEDAYAELVDYYDFSQVHDGWEDVDGDGQTAGEVVQVGDVEPDEVAGEWQLPTGNVIGHRSLVRYYKQRLRPENNERQSVALARVALQYQSMGQVSGRMSQGLTMAKIRERQEERVHERNNRKQVNTAVKSNKLQRYFRPQVDF